MGRCSGCSGDRCSCVIKAGSGTRVDGAGTRENPYVITVEGTGGEGGGSGFLPGMIMPYGGGVAPAGWLIANGQVINRTAYAALFTAIGTTYGAGDGSTTFAVPDLAGRMPMGADGSFPLGSQGGAASTVLDMTQVPQHSHTIAHTHDASHNHSASSGAVNLDHLHYFDTGYSGGHSHSYLSNVNRQQYSSGGSFGGTYAEGWSTTGGDGGHSHAGYTAAADRSLNHAHSVTVDTRNMSTGAASTPNSGNAGSANPAAVPTMPPYTGVTFLIKT